MVYISMLVYMSSADIMGSLLQLVTILWVSIKFEESQSICLSYVMPQYLGYLLTGCQALFELCSDFKPRFCIAGIL